MCEEIEFEIQEEDIPLTMDLEDDVYLVEPKTENLEVTPTKETQYFESETGIYYDNVTVNKIPDEYIIPNLGTKTITKNGTYNATDDNLDGYSKVEVTTSGADINDYFETTYNGTSPSSWVSQNFVKKVPDLVIDDSVTSLQSFCNNIGFCPKIICNSNITNMSSLYYSNKSKSIDVSGLNTSKVTNMREMFSECYYITSLNLSNFNTNNVKSMYKLFYNCSSLTSLDVSNFDTTNVTTMYGMFFNCNILTSLDLSNFNTTNLTNISYMFQNCSSLTSLNLSNFDTSKINNMTFAFGGCKKLSNLDIRNFDFSNVTSYNNMFSNVPADCLIIVKDDTAKTWITEKFTKLTNVKTVAELEAA